MSISAFRCAAVLFLASFEEVASLHGQTIRVGNELQVNTHTTSAQQIPAVALDGEGNFVVSWTSYGQDGSGFGVFARRFDAAGVAQAAEFQVNSYTTGPQGPCGAAVTAGGDFVIAWQGDAQDGSGLGIFAQRFNAAGMPQASELQLNAYTNGDQVFCALSMGTDGRFVVAWQSTGRDGDEEGVFARRFGADGSAQGTDFQVNTYTPHFQYRPSVSVDGDGDFIVAWASIGQDDASSGIFAQRFDSSGLPQGAELQVNTYTTSAQGKPAVSLDEDGDFVVTWEGLFQDGSSDGVFARRFDADGSPLATEFQVNSYTDGNQSDPALAIGSAGDFVVTWKSLGQDGSEEGVFVRHFDAAGAALATEFLVNSWTASSQYQQVVAGNVAGDFVVTWMSYVQDGSAGGVFAQRFTTPAVLDIDADGDTDPLTDGLLVLRYLFGFTGAALVSGAVDLVHCTRCNAPTIESYLQLLI